MGTAPPYPPPDWAAHWRAWAAPFFDFDVLVVRQKLLAIAEKYLIEDEHGRPRFYVVRPPRLALNVALGVLVSIVNLALLFGAANLALMRGQLLAGALLLFGGRLFLSLGAILLAPLRPIRVYTDESMAWPLLDITQDNKFGLTRRYSLYDMTGALVARFERDTLRSILRRDWQVFGPDGAPMFTASEDSLTRAILRRWFGPMYGLLRLHFVLDFPGGVRFGSYERDFTFRDQYTLGVHADAARRADRRAILALCILLDTGEVR